MNIDQIYKPLMKKYHKGYTSTGFEYDTKDVQDLEEKYKELLADRIEQTVYWYITGAGEFIDLTEDISLLEKHTGLSWEELQE